MEEVPLGNNVDITELISQLQHEQLLIYSERQVILDLNQKVNTSTDDLLRVAWINLQQRVNLNALVVARQDFTPEQCCRKADSLANSIFIDGKDILDYQMLLNYSDFLSMLRTRPEQVAQWIVIGEALTQDQRLFSSILHSIVAGLYGSLLLPQDTSLMLNLLRYLATLQLVTTDNPRRLLRQGSCAFSKMYFLFHEGLTSAKLFLIAALQNPIVKLIASSDCFLDIDANKTLSRFTQSEKLEKFGQEGTDTYNFKTLQYRKWVVQSLSELAMSFISSLQDNVYCFPTTLAWLIRQIASMISKSFGPHSKEINAISTDLIFTLFICPAIVQPEPYGICDAPISEIARHNLMQVGQILQMLALLKFETPDAKIMDLYKMFDADCISNVLDILLNNMEHVGDDTPIENVPAVQRNVAHFTEQELYNLVTFLKRAHNSILQDQGGGGNEAASTDFCSNNGDNATSLPSDALVVLLNKLPTGNEGSPRSTLQPNNQLSPINSGSSKNLLHKAKSHLSRSPSSLNGDSEQEAQLPTTVLSIPLHQEQKEHIGLLSEQKILTMNTTVMQEENLLELDGPNLLLDESLLGENLLDMSIPEMIDEPDMPIIQGQEKRTRFSHNDEGSIGNTSDNLEVISEAASNHSVASSIELENEDQNDADNLSDMVSANVSGRGTPNISGRDTPSSQVTENEENRPLAEVRPPYLQQPQPSLMSKQIRSEIDDKFCKFEIKKLLEGDETISIISDTWSTDVLASDSETIDASDRHEQSNFSPIIEQPVLPNPLNDVSETQSESAWSTDVLSSDTERLTEVDNDDLASVAPSDDTASVARSDDAASVAPSDRSELDDHDRRLSTASSTANHFMCYQSSQNNSPSAFQEYRRMDMRRESMPNYIVSSAKSERHSEARASFERQTVTYSSSSQIDPSILRPGIRNAADSSRREAMLIESTKLSSEKRSILGDISNREMPGTSKTCTPEATAPASISGVAYLLVKNVQEAHKYEDIKTDMQLSNTSLNSSSSGSSNSSEAKNNALQHAGDGAAGGGWKKNKVWMNGSSDDSTMLSAESNGKKSTVTKPSRSTGAIPKSISFDMSAEKGDKEADDDSKHKRSGFFGKFRMNFKNRRGKTFRASSADEYNNGVRFETPNDDELRFRRIGDFNGRRNTITSTTEASDILAKYRTKQPIENGSISVINMLKSEKPADLEDVKSIVDDNIDSNTLFTDAKKKLRLVLSHSKTHSLKTKHVGKRDVKKDLESYLQIELAKARDLKQWSTAARVSEALRCVRLLDIAGFARMCASLREDYCNRSCFRKYLLVSKQILLSSHAFLDELYDQVERDKELCGSFLVAVCVRLFLERHEQELQRFRDEFQLFTLVDEKNDHLAQFLDRLFSSMRKDSLWQDANDGQMQMAHEAIERTVMTEVYQHALYPNGDGDRHRDSLLNEHLGKLSSMITPGHKYLMISKIHQNECPWIPAQEALQAMAAYRTPRDKVRCVARCASAIMDLLSLASGRGSSTADDIIPVLVYVIIKVNPQDLLSTIQYVNSFYGTLSGEAEYWWTQFCSAVEYTKTMEYSD